VPTRRSERLTYEPARFEQPAVQTAARESAAYLSARYAWYVVALLTLAYVFSFIDRQILNLLVGPIQRDLDISKKRLSICQPDANCRL
jgi:hypothetical protein